METNKHTAERVTYLSATLFEHSNAGGLEEAEEIEQVLAAYAASLRAPVPDKLHLTLTGASPLYCVLVTVASNPGRTHCLGPYVSPDAAAAVVAKAARKDGCTVHGQYEYDNGVYTLRVLPLVGGVS